MGLAKGQSVASGAGVQSKAKLHGVQVLRAVAAYAVVAFHIMEFVRQYDLGVPRFATGRGGVDLFFVISGFVMVHVTADDERPVAFWSKRVARIVPLYWAATIGAVVFSLTVPWAFPSADVSVESIAASLLFIPHEDMGGHLQPILFVGWTLNLEVMFYLLFGASLALPSAMRLPVLCLSLGTGVLAAHFLAEGPIAFYGNFIVLEFVVGCLLGAILKRGFWRRVPRPVIVSLPIGLGLAGFVAAAFTTSAEPNRLIIYGVPASLLVFGVAARDIVGPNTRLPFFERLGNASYSAYLIHPFLVVVWGASATRLFGGSWAGALCMAAGTLVTTMAVSQVSFTVFEQRASKAVRLFLDRLTKQKTLVGAHS